MRTAKAKPKAKAKAKPVTSTDRAADLLSRLQPIVARHLPLLRRSADLHGDFAEFFGECLPIWLNHYSAIDGLIADRLDLETVVFRGVPGILSDWLIELLNGRPADRILSAFTRRHLTRALRLLSHRLEPPDDPLGMVLPTVGQDPDTIDPAHIITESLALELEDEIADFGAHVFFADPQPEPTTDAQRRAARERRLENYQHVAGLQGVKTSFSEVCRIAKVRRTGRGSGEMWKEGKLPDDGKVSRAIEAVLDFRSIR
jgi:hypothetical protein